MRRCDGNVEGYIEGFQKSKTWFQDLNFRSQQCLVGGLGRGHTGRSLSDPIVTATRG